MPNLMIQGHIYNVTIYILNNIFNVLVIKQKILKKCITVSTEILSSSTVFNIDNNEKYFLSTNVWNAAYVSSWLVFGTQSKCIQYLSVSSVLRCGLSCGPTGNRADFSASAQRRIMEVVNTARVRQSMLEAECSEVPDSDVMVPDDTWIFPLVQMKPLGIHLDEQVTKRLLTEAGGDAVVYLTSGYFNLTRTYMQLVLGAAADYRILMASPEVNGFFGAKGVAGAIPEAYIHLARQFYNKVCIFSEV